MFTLYPLGRLLVFSLHDWDGISKNPQWIWFDNYSAVFANKFFWLALRHNLWWVVLASIPIVLGTGIGRGFALRETAWKKRIQDSGISSLYIGGSC